MSKDPNKAGGNHGNEGNNSSWLNTLIKLGGGIAVSYGCYYAWLQYQKIMKNNNKNKNKNNKNINDNVFFDENSNIRVTPGGDIIFDASTNTPGNGGGDFMGIPDDETLKKFKMSAEQYLLQKLKLRRFESPLCNPHLLHAKHEFYFHFSYCFMNEKKKHNKIVCVCVTVVP